MDEQKVKKKMPTWKKVVIISFSSIFALILIFCATFYGIFFNEINAFITIKKESDNIYSMTYKNDYFFDDFLKSGAKNDKELKSYIVTKLLHGMPIDFALPNYGCSSFTATTEQGEHTFARNLDVDYGSVMVVRTSPKNGYSSLSMVDLSALGFSMTYEPDSFADKLLLLATPYIPFDGVNEKGVAICVNMVNGTDINQNTDRIDITTTTMIRLVLDKASNVDEAIELIKKYDLHDSTGGPFHFLIADKSGKSVVIEYYKNEMQIIESNSNFQILTNHPLNSLETEESSFIATYKRYNIINDKLTQTSGILSVENSMELLQEVKLSWAMEKGGTLYSVVYNLDKPKFQFVYRSNTQKVYNFSL